MTAGELVEMTVDPVDELAAEIMVEELERLERLLAKHLAFQRYLKGRDE